MTDYRHTEPTPGSADKWWKENATEAEKANYEWIRENAPLHEPDRQQIGYDGTPLRQASKIPEWWYRLKYPKPTKKTKLR